MVASMLRSNDVLSGVRFKHARWGKLGCLEQANRQARKNHWVLRQSELAIAWRGIFYLKGKGIGPDWRKELGK